MAASATKEESMNAPATLAPTVTARTFDDGSAVVALAGVVDERAIDALDDAFALTIAPGTRLVVDLSRATRVDSIALGALAYAAKRVAAVGGRTSFRGANGDVRRAFELTGLDRVLALAV
jgi:anti-anti-sigma factor